VGSFKRLKGEVRRIGETLVQAKLVKGVWQEIDDDSLTILTKGGDEETYELSPDLKVDNKFIDENLGKEIELVIRDDQVVNIRSL
jgi:hypothetical protein